MNQNFTDIVNGVSDGTKDLSINALTVAGNANFNGNTTIGNATSDVCTVTAFVGSNITPGTTNTYDLGITTTNGWRAIYISSSSNTKTTKIQGPASAADTVLTLPLLGGTLGLNMAKNSIQSFASGTGTYTTPAGCVAIKVTMIGSGGAGSGSGSAAAGNGGGGNSSTFGSSLLTAAGGGGGTFVGAGGAGGSATIASPAFGLALGGAPGSSFNGGDLTLKLCGLPGGDSPFGGAGGGGNYNTVGGSGNTNTGGGGGAGGNSGALNSVTGSSGGGGGGLVAWIVGPSATYSYAVGAASTAGTAGTSGLAGGGGASGAIYVEEFY